MSVDTAGDDAAGESVGPPSTGGGWKRWLPLLALALLMAAAFASGLHRYLSLDALVEQRRSLQAFIERQPVVALLSYAGVYVGTTALSLPGAGLLSVAGGFLFGIPTGWLAAAVSASLGAMLFFLATRTTLGDAVRERAGPRLAGLAEGFRADSASYLLALRLAPIIPFWLVNLAASVFGVRLRTFAWTTFVGVLPGSFAFALAGQGLDGVIDTQARAAAACVAAGRTACASTLSLRDLVTTELLLALAAIAAAALIPVLVKRFQAVRRARTAQT